MAKKAIVLLAEGFEEIEAVTPIDYLRRAGIAVTTAAVGDNQSIKGARGITIQADTLLSACAPEQAAYDAIIIPGGMPGASHIAASSAAGALIRAMAAAGKLVCAICASPVVVLAPLGLLSGKHYTCYPGMEKQAHDGIWTEGSTVVDGALITSRAAGTAGDFADAIIRRLLSAHEADTIAASVLL